MSFGFVAAARAWDQFAYEIVVLEAGIIVMFALVLVIVGRIRNNKAKHVETE